MRPVDGQPTGALQHPDAADLAELTLHPGAAQDIAAQDIAAQDIAAQDIAAQDIAARDIGAHVASCASCTAQVQAYADIAELVRADHRAQIEPHVQPPPAVWDRIREAVDVEPSADPAPVRYPTTRATHPRRLMAAAAAVLLLAVVAVGGYAIGHRDRTTTTAAAAAVTARALLDARPGGPTGVRGSATLTTSAQGPVLSVRTDGLPTPNGYYEVWLYNPSTTIMVAVGTLGVGHEGSFVVPPTLNLKGYHVVDVSAQKLNGDNRHQRSVLRGPLSPRP